MPASARENGLDAARQPGLRAGDLLALLSLQLQIEQIDTRDIANAGEQRLKHYNKVLAEQLAELKAEIEEVEMQFCTQFGIGPGQRLNPRQLDHILESSNRQWLAELARQQRELRMLNDHAATRRWLKPPAAAAPRGRIQLRAFLSSASTARAAISASA
jgi:hypothetical protein